ncbi:MAG: DNA recombination/repair protein RecA, partial [Clostridiales bacterium]|nr:DNA recombination/repair protein RecA [Clostridiales bacterium]
YSSVRIDIRKGEPIKESGEVVGNKTRAKIVKNKLASPFRTAVFDMVFGKGVSREGSLIDLGEAYGFVQKTGTWLSIGEERIGQGRENAKKYLLENTAAAKSLEEKVKQAAASGAPIVVKPAKGAKAAAASGANESDSFEVVEETQE